MKSRRKQMKERIMNKRNLHIDLIEKYLDDNLEGDELTLFDETLERDEEFVREINDMELLIAGIRNSAKSTTIEEKLARFDANIKIMEDNEEPTIHNSILNFERIKKYSWAIAASITLALVVSISLINIEQTPSHRKIYAEYYQPFENFGKKRAPENLTKDYWKEALHNYDEGKYQQALDCFDKIIVTDYKNLVNDPRYSLYKLYKGNTLMKLDRHQEAATLFEGIIQDDAGMTMQAKWYLAMCYLYENDSENLISTLEEIARVEESSYSAKAKEVLASL
jgi:tetratricopeptide (TPR) repeat protein